MHYLIYYSFILYNGDTDPAIVYHAAYLQEILNTIIIDLRMKGGGGGMGGNSLPKPLWIENVRYI